MHTNPVKSTTVIETERKLAECPHLGVKEILAEESSTTRDFDESGDDVVRTEEPPKNLHDTTETESLTCTDEDPPGVYAIEGSEGMQPNYLLIKL